MNTLPDLKNLRADARQAAYVGHKFESRGETILALLDAYEASSRDAESMKAKVDGFTSVLKRYQDARVFTNIHTRQIARSIAEDSELDTARLLDDAGRHATKGE